jgi:hypothetical protein
VEHPAAVGNANMAICEPHVSTVYVCFVVGLGDASFLAAGLTACECTVVYLCWVVDTPFSSGLAILGLV